MTYTELFEMELYTHNHNDINNNCTYTYAKTQADSNTQVTPLFRYEPFINFWLLDFGSSTWGERDIILKVFRIITMLTKLKCSAHLVEF